MGVLTSILAVFLVVVLVVVLAAFLTVSQIILPLFALCYLWVVQTKSAWFSALVEILPMMEQEQHNRDRDCHDDVPVGVSKELCQGTVEEGAPIPQESAHVADKCRHAEGNKDGESTSHCRSGQAARAACAWWEALIPDVKDAHDEARDFVKDHVNVWAQTCGLLNRRQGNDDHEANHSRQDGKREHPRRVEGPQVFACLGMGLQKPGDAVHRLDVGLDDGKADDHGDHEAYMNQKGLVGAAAFSAGATLDPPHKVVNRSLLQAPAASHAWTLNSQRSIVQWKAGNVIFTAAILVSCFAGTENCYDLGVRRDGDEEP
ncbi:uncharacterized protein BKA78DRAFT_342456 [Phyllosticta capitalensis]|uniref:uncharacterized protein n=1 Tax=Phyllosticta capitalensis TaxID=121624 RepID=UPI003131CF00